MPNSSGPRGRTLVIALSLLTILSRPAFAIEPLPPEIAPSVPCSAPVTEISPDAPPPANPRPNIRLNEVLPDPIGDDSAAEFMELRNDDDSDVDLTGWSITDASEKKFSLQGAHIPAHGVMSFVYSESRLILNNDGERLSLADPDGALVDEISFNAHGHAGESYARSMDAQTEAGTGGSWKWTILPTPGAANAIEERVPDPADANGTGASTTPTAPVAPVAPPQTEPIAPQIPDTLSLTAFLPNPVGSDDAEWIEIMNGGDSSIPLDGWKLDDEEGGSDPFTFAKTDSIAAHAIVRVPRTASRLALNNDRDTVRLFSPNGTIREDVSYSNAAEGKIFSKVGGQWQWNVTEPTTDTTPVPDAPSTPDAAPAKPPPSAPDIIQPSQPAPDVPATEPTPTNADDGLTELSGIVTVPPGRISKATFLMLDDAGRGFTVRMYGKAGPAFAAGDHISVRGRLHDTDARPWISVTRERVVLSGKRTEIAYEERDMGALTEDDIGLPVSIQGLLTKHGSGWLRIADADGGVEVKATLPNGISTGQIAGGSTIKIRGVLRWVSGGPEIVLSSRKQLAIIATSEVQSDKEREQKIVTTALARSEPTLRTPLVLGSVEKTDRRPLSAGIAMLGFTALVVAGVIWKKRMRVTATSAAERDLDLGI